VLGATGKNFAAGMSGGVAYIYDIDGKFEERCNRAMCKTVRLEDADEIKTLRGIIYRHLEATDSTRAKEILDDWSVTAGKFWKIEPAAPPASPKAPLAPNNVPPAPTDLGKA
jgi:glutamate synthase domain-containing protein 3